jgi:DUF2927 family protein
VAFLLILGGCQTTVNLNTPAESKLIAYGLYGREIPLPPAAGDDWQVAVERRHTGSRGTPLADVLMTRLDNGKVSAIVWATASGPIPSGKTMDWQAPAFCNGDTVDIAKQYSGIFWPGQDCWGVKQEDEIFITSANPTVRQFRDWAAQIGATINEKLATVSYRYANSRGLVEVTYAFDPDHLVPLTLPFYDAPRQEGEHLLAEWAQRFHVKVRLGYHGLAVRGVQPSAVTQDYTRTALVTDTKRQPSETGTTLPGATFPLHRVYGLIGDIPTTKSSDLITQNFERLIFQTEFGGPDPWLRKWNRHPVLRFARSARPRTKEALAAAATRLSQITGLSFSRVEVPEALSEEIDDHKRAGVITVLDKPGNVGAQNCTGRLFYGKDGSILSAVLSIGSAYENYEIDECVTEELAQSLGPINDTTVVPQSMFNDQTNGIVTALTWHDAVVLRALYSDNLTTGMPRAKALPVMRAEIWKTLNDLEKNIRHTRTEY